MRTQRVNPVTKSDVLDHLARSVPFGESVVQIGASVHWPGAMTERSSLENLSIGLLHLGPENHEQMEYLTPWLAKGATVLFEEAHDEDSRAYNYAVGWAARGFLSSPVHARHWDGLLVCTYFGGSK